MKNKYLIGFIIFFVGAIALMYWVFMSQNSNRCDLYIKTGDTKDSLLAQLHRNNALNQTASFALASKLITFSKVYPGYYLLNKGMSNREILNMFKYGKQKEISFRFGNNVLPEELYHALDLKFEADSSAFAQAINASGELKALGLDSLSVLAMFWADTYQFPWSVKPIQMVRRFVNEQQVFWDEKRMSKLGRTGFTSTKSVYILASIIEKEAMKKEELPKIAGVYINRLRIGMPLQADPTVKYAAGIKFMQRVTGILQTESPYNTYIHKGLPPGPIGIATKAGIDAVLDFESHDFLYFCAKEDFSGVHNFSKTYSEHLVFAKKYRAALDAKQIK